MIRLSVTLALVLQAAPALAGALPEQFPLGRDGRQEPCTASRSWSAGRDGIAYAAGQGFAIACRGIAAARTQGYIDPPQSTPNTVASDCGAPQTVALPRLGTATVRQCRDVRLGQAAVDIRLVRRGRHWHGAAVPGAVGPLTMLLQVAAGGARPPRPLDSTALAFAPDSLAPAPAAEAAAATALGGYDPAAALRQGLALIHGGRHVDASRLLNDAVGQFAEAGLLTRAELRLNAGLADSNISQFDAANGHFDAADLLLSAAPPSPDRANLLQQANVYRGLHAVNRQQWREAIDQLQRVGGQGFPLSDTVTLTQLNRSGGGAVGALAVADTSQLAALVIEAQKQWALSVAHLGLGDDLAAEAALRAAVPPVRALQRSVGPDGIAWLRAGLERQQGRISAKAGAIDAAVASFDCALIVLQGGLVPRSARCLFVDAEGRQRPTPASLTVIAETQLERAALLTRQPGMDQATLLQQYGAAVETLALENTATGNAPPSLGPYLDLLAAGGDTPAPAVAEAFFRALQTTGEPAVAREYARLQSVVAGDADVAADLRDRGELEREATRLRYEIAALAPGDRTALAALEAQRGDVLARLEIVQGRLLKSAAFRAVSDRPVGVAEVASVLRPGEAYLKLSEVSRGLYGIAITRDRTMLWKVAEPAAAIETRARDVLATARSSRDESGRTRIRPFDVIGASALFQAIAGPAATLIAAAPAVTVEATGALRNLPPAILVSDAASARTYAAQPNRSDYTMVGYLGRRAEVATALSARSLVIGRGAAARSAAPEPFLGLGENAYAPAPDGPLANRMVQLAPACRVRYADWARAFNANTPISAAEIRLAANALGIVGAPQITGAAFTDARLLAAASSGELARYQVLHFATHGLPATAFDAPGCESALPPSLLTTLLPPDADGRDEADGLLSFDDVARLRLNANLVFLSACDTAAGVGTAAGRLAGQEDSTPTLDGLVRAFLAAGSKAVVATSWNVPALPQSDELVAAFYRAGKTQAISAALASAQRILMDRPGISHPYFWGAYFVVGDGSRPMLTPRAGVVAAAH